MESIYLLNKPFATIFFMLITLAGFSQPLIKESMYKAYLTSNTEELEKILKNQLEVVSNRTDFDSQMQLAYCYFSLLNSTVGTRNKAIFYRHVDPAKKLLKQLIDSYKKSGETMAMLSAIYGLEISYSPIKGITLGSKSSALAEQAKALQPESPLVTRVYGTNKFYTPAAFGGDLKVAINALYNSISQFESKPEETLHNWLYLDTLALLGQALEKNNQRNGAIEVYEKALKIEPGFDWVRQVLLPKARAN